MLGTGQATQSRARHTNAFAVAAVVCGIIQFGYLLYKPLALTGLAAIVFGHLATHQIRRTGQQGYQLARAGLILGYGVLILAVLAPLVLLSVAPPVQ